MNEFAKYHPLINFIYFTAVIVFSMIFVHPICLVTSLLCSVMYSIILNGKKALKFIAMLLPLMLISALINPAFNHEGVTVIAYLPSGNPLTLESILYGIVAASMVAMVICWFSCFNKIMTSDKFIYIFKNFKIITFKCKVFCYPILAQTDKIVFVFGFIFYNFHINHTFS